MEEESNIEREKEKQNKTKQNKSNMKEIWEREGDVDFENGRQRQKGAMCMWRPSIARFSFLICNMKQAVLETSRAKQWDMR